MLEVEAKVGEMCVIVSTEANVHLGQNVSLSTNVVFVVKSVTALGTVERQQILQPIKVMSAIRFKFLSSKDKETGENFIKKCKVDDA